MKNKDLHKLFEKEMTRREFLAHVGVAVLIFIGYKSIVGHLINFHTSAPKVKSGYGANPYGG